MLNLSQLPNKRSYVIACFLLIFTLISFDLSSGIEFGASPSTINFDAKEGERICKNVKILSSSDNLDVKVNDIWTSSAKSRYPAGYNLSSQDLDMVLEYKREITVEGEKGIAVCLTAAKSGSYRGVIFFDAGNLAVGVRINAHITGKNDLPGQSITGLASMGDSNEYNSIERLAGPNYKVILIMLFNTLLFVLLLLLLIRIRRKGILGLKRLEF